MTHFTDIELQRWRQSGPGADRERVIEHLAVCGECAGRYAAVIRNRPLSAEVATDASDFAAAGRRVGARRAVQRKRWMLSIAAAAILLIIVALPIGWHRHDSIPDLHFRGVALVALAPQGALDASDVEFVWSSAITAARYRVQVGDGSRIVYTAEVVGTRWSPPPALRETLQPNVEYWWTATALDSSGKPLTRSAPKTFTIRPR